jgi:hypothetical protein
MQAKRTAIFVKPDRSSVPSFVASITRHTRLRYGCIKHVSDSAHSLKESMRERVMGRAFTHGSDTTMQEHRAENASGTT